MNILTKLRNKKTNFCAFIKTNIKALKSKRSRANYKNANSDVYNSGTIRDTGKATNAVTNNQSFINYESSTSTSNILQRLIHNPQFYLGLGLMGFVGLDASNVYAAAFDLDKGVSELVTPFITVINKHWGKGLLIMGAGGALIAQGDLKTRMIGVGTGVGIGGVLMIGMKAALGID